MQGIAESVDRRRLLQEAIAAAKPGETITNTEMMDIWGVSKGRWTDVRNRIAGFPIPITSGNKQLYPKVEALAAMWKHETARDAVEAAKSQKMSALLGLDMEDGPTLSLSDMQKASALRGEIEQRLVAQRELLPKNAVQQLCGRIGEYLSRRLGNLGAVIDPNGVYPPEIRASLDKHGKEWLLRAHTEMGQMLTGNADATPAGSGRDRTRPSRARTTAAPRKR